MGLDTTHNAWHGSYAYFNRFRRQLAAQIGIDLDSFEGFGGSNKFENVKHGIVPLLNHSDCDGKLKVSECRRIAKGLDQILESFDETKPHGCDLKDLIEQFRDGCLDAVSKRQQIYFR